MSDAWNDPLLPPSQTRLEAAIGRSMPPIGLSPEVITTLWNPMEIPAALLPWLAWALSVDEWDATWPESTQRAVCAASFQVHQRKGTVGAVRRAMDAIGYRTRLLEAWKQTPPGVPHNFTAEIEIDDRGLDATLVSQMERQINAVKPERSHFDIHLVARTDCLINVAATTLSGDIVSINPYQIGLAVAPQAMFLFGAGIHDQSEITLYPMMN